MKHKVKTKYRVVPTINEKYGSCWAVKEGKNIIGVFINKDSADRKVMALEAAIIEAHLLNSTRNQELTIFD